MVKTPQEANKQTSVLFNRFIQSETCNQTFSTFLDFCQSACLQYPPAPSFKGSSCSLEHVHFYPHLKKKLASSWKANAIFSKLDKRFHGKEYSVNVKSGTKAGEELKVFIIGAGPCGLRTAIEMSCLGAKVVLVEKRDNFSRNNILHLWPFLITDLKTLGAKKIYGRFCAGSLDHISIRQLQLILLKIALILGVEIIFNVTFERLISPQLDEQNEDIIKGWTAEVNELNHPVSKYEFDVIIGADGKRNTLKGFKRKEFRGKLAIGLTVNFINRNTTAEAKVEEISGVAYIFNQEFFKNLHNETGIDLENIVYYKGETHYFVMTAKKHSLLAKGVLKQDFDETAKLLSRNNVDHELLMQYTKEAADFSTHHQLPNMEFAFNQYGQADVALFDFTCMYAAENAALFHEEKGCKLLSCLVGDSLLEPFWPMGTGCARGFLASFDAAWMIKQWCLQRRDDLDCAAELRVLAERESVYRLLHQTSPETSSKKIAAYTIDPQTRYNNFNKNFVKPHQVVKHYLADREIASPNLTAAQESTQDAPSLEDNMMSIPGSNFSRKVSMVRSNKLLNWCRKVTETYEGVNVENLTSSWKSGLALCAIIHSFRPDLINWNELDPNEVEENNQLAFTIAEEQLGISPVMSGKEIATCETVDKLIMIAYLSQIYEVFKYETPAKEMLEFNTESEHAAEEGPESAPKSSHTHNKLSLTSPIGLLIRFTQHMKRRTSTPKKGSKRKKSDDVEPTSPAEKLPALLEVEEKERASLDAPTMKIDDVQVKLRQKSPTDSARVNQRASNRISALSNQLISQWEQNSPEVVCKPIKRQVDIAEIPASSSNQCYFCNQRVHVFERTGAEGVFFHRNCFVCAHCGITLRRGAYLFVEETGKFFCHKFCQNDSETCAVVLSPSIETKPFTFEEDKADGVGNYRTPERIELENIRMSMLDDPQELPEEDVTRHNHPVEVESSEDEELDTMSDFFSDDDEGWDLEKIEAAEGMMQVEGSFTSLDEDSDASLADITTDQSNASVADISTPVSDYSDGSPGDITSDEDYDETPRVATIKRDSSSSEDESAVDNDMEDHPDQFETKKQTSPEKVLRSRSLSSTSTQSSSSSEYEIVLRHRDVIVSSPTITTKEPEENIALRNIKPQASFKRELSSSSSLLSSESDVEEHKASKHRLEQSSQNIAQENTKQPTATFKRELSSSSDSLSSVSDSDDQGVLDLLEEKPSPDINRKVASLLKKEMGTSFFNQKHQEPPEKPSRKTLPRAPLTDSVLIKASTLPAEIDREKQVRHQPSQSFNEAMLRSYKQHDVTNDSSQQPPVERNLEQRVKDRLKARNEWLSEDSHFGKPLTRSHSDRSPRKPAPWDKHSKSATSTPTKTLSNVSVVDSTSSASSVPIAWGNVPKTSKDSNRIVPNVSASGETTPTSRDAHKTTPSAKKRSLPPLPQASSASKSCDGTEPMDNEIEFRKRLIKEKLERMKANTMKKKALGLAQDNGEAKVSSNTRDNVAEEEDELKKRLEKEKEAYLKAKSIKKRGQGLFQAGGKTKILPTPKTTSNEEEIRKQLKKEKMEYIKLLDKQSPKPPSEVPMVEIDGPMPDTSAEIRTNVQTPEARVKRTLPVPKLRSKQSDLSSVDRKDSQKESTKKPVTDSEKVTDENEKKNTPFFQLVTKKRQVKEKKKRLSEEIKDQSAISSSASQTTEQSDDLPSTSEKNSQGAATGSLPKAGTRRKLPSIDILAKMKRKVQAAARRQEKLEAQQRLHRAQTIQRSLEEVEVKQRRLEERGVQLENLLRSETDATEESNNMLEWFKLIQEKNALLRYENELMINQRELQLEDSQSRLQQKLRDIMAVDVKSKTTAQYHEEKEVLQKMMDVVDQREELRAILEEQRLKEKDESFNVETVVLKKFDVEDQAN